MCRHSTLLGLPHKPFPPCQHQCPICLMSKFSHPPKGPTTSTSHLSPGQLLHIDFGFRDITSHRGFSSMLLIIDAKTCMLWIFCTANKRAPIKILSYFFSIMKKENKNITTIRVDEDGALARSYEFTELLLQHSITLETTGGYASFLNGKVERPNRTIADMVHALYFNAGHSPDKWCYAAETAADIYRLTLHSALGISPYEAWYGVKPRIDDLRVWGCTVYVCNPSPKKTDSKVQRGYFMGFTKSRLLIRWLDPSTDTIKHACAVRFDEHDVPLSSTNTPSPGSLLLRDDPSITIPQPTTEIDITNSPHLDSNIFSLTFTLPPLGQYLGCQLSTCLYNNLPYFSSFTKGTQLAQLFSSYGSHNTTYWILSINNKEFSHAPSVVNYIRSIQNPNTTTPVTGFFAKRNSSTTRSNFEEHRALFNQIRLTITPSKDSTSSDSTPIPVPLGFTTLVSPTRPIAPDHIGQLQNKPFYSDWKSSLFKNYDKMLTAGTWSAPILRSSVPSTKKILRNRVTFKVKDTDQVSTYELYSRTCADGSPMKENIDYITSYSPVGSIDGIRLILAIAASRKMKLNVLDISNAFQTSVVFDPSERTYITLPPFYLEWFRHNWPDYKLPSLLSKDLVIQCLRSIQGTKDAGNRWYHLLKAKLLELGMTTSTLDHGIFIWSWQHHTCLSVLETDDLLMASDDDAPFHHLTTELRKMFDLTCCHDSILKFLNLRLIQSPIGISFDQINHIKTQILDPYFSKTPKNSIP
jgi:hypothetical protein